MSNTTITLPSGRRAGLSAFGDPMAQRIAIICHPTPGSSGFDPDPTITERWGVRLLGLDRPGYGSSEPISERELHTLSERADDVAAFIEADEQNANRISGTDLQHCGVIGWGAGAIVAAGLAVRHPALVDRLALVSPMTVPRATAASGRTLTVADGLDALQVTESDPAFARHLGLDRRVDRMIAMSFEQGSAGLIGDRELFANDGWSAGLRDLDLPVLVLTGAQDPAIGDAEIEWWRQRLPESSEFRVVEHSAGLTIADAWEAVLGHVAPAHGHIDPNDRDHGAPRLPALGGDSS